MDRQEQFFNIVDGMMADAQSAALLLAMSNSSGAEEALRQLAIKKGFKCAVTEFGGTEEAFKRKIVNAVVGASLNNNIIEKSHAGIHAVIHATDEASRGFLVSLGMTANVALKIAIVRDSKWVSVAFYGSSGLHYSTNHKRSCVGTIHI